MKRYIKQSVALLVMLLIVAGAIGYGEELFHLSFAERTPQQSGAPEPTPSPEWNLPAQGGGTSVNTTSAAQLAGLASVYDFLASGKRVSTQKYSSISTLAVAVLGEDAPFSVRLATIANEVRVPIGNDAAYRSEIAFQTAAQPVYTMYMGYILYENGTDRRLLDATGACLLTDFVFAPAYARDAQGNPLFVVGETYYRYDAQTGSMCKTTLDKTVLPMATGQDYVAVPQSPYIRFCENGKWGYRSAQDGTVVVPATYAYAYDFQKNHDSQEDRAEYAYLAVVFSAEDGQLKIIDTTGTVVVSTRKSIEYGVSDGVETTLFEAWESCVLPERTDNNFVLGMDGVDAYGMVRVRRRVVRKTSQDVVPVDEDTLLCIRRNGDDYGYHATYFEIPKGYRLCAYAEGVLLLQDEAKGTYGYYSHQGYWLTNPDFSEASPMREGLAVVRTAENKFGVIDASGAWVLLPTFSYISAPSDGAMLVYDTTTGWRVVCKMK